MYLSVVNIFFNEIGLHICSYSTKSLRNKVFACVFRVFSMKHFLVNIFIQRSTLCLLIHMHMCHSWKHLSLLWKVICLKNKTSVSWQNNFLCLYQGLYLRNLSFLMKRAKGFVFFFFFYNYLTFCICLWSLSLSLWLNG